jgi:hypothetical protein
MYRFSLFFLLIGYLAMWGQFASPLQADGLSDLKAALGRYTAKSTLKGTLQAQTRTVQGKGKDANEIKGQASAWIEYDPKGLRMKWDRPFLLKLDQETRLRTKGGKLNNQPSGALWAMELHRTYSLLNATEGLSLMVETATFQNEAQEMLEGRAVRVLQFSRPQSGVPEWIRRWVKDFNSTVKIWIDSDGKPLKYQETIQIKARAFLVISFEETREIDVNYSNINDHLVCVRHEEKIESSGGGEYVSSWTLRTFKPQ